MASIQYTCWQKHSHGISTSKFNHQANTRGKYADGFYSSIINEKDGHLLSPLIMFTCTTLHHALLEWQKIIGVDQKASKSKLKADTPDRSNHFNYYNDGGKNASCCAATGPKFLTSPGIADTYTFLMNTWDTLPESYQQMVYNNTLATVKRQIQQAENPTPAVALSLKAVCVENAILLDYLTSEVALEEPQIRHIDPNILIDNNCMNDELHFGMPGGSGNYEDEGGKSDERNAIPTASRRWRPATGLERFDLETSEVDGYEGEDGDDADADEKKGMLQADDESTQNVKDWGHSWFDLGTSDVDRYECEDDNDADADDDD